MMNLSQNEMLVLREELLTLIEIRMDSLEEYTENDPETVNKLRTFVGLLNRIDRELHLEPYGGSLYKACIEMLMEDEKDEIREGKIVVETLYEDLRRDQSGYYPMNKEETLSITPGMGAVLSECISSKMESVIDELNLGLREGDITEEDVVFLNGFIQELYELSKLFSGKEEYLSWEQVKKEAVGLTFRRSLKNLILNDEWCNEEDEDGAVDPFDPEGSCSGVMYQFACDNVSLEEFEITILSEYCHGCDECIFKNKVGTLIQKIVAAYEDTLTEE